MDKTIDYLINKYGKEKTDKLLSYLDMVLERNNYINLTAVKSREEALQKHIIDSLSICDMPEYIAANRVIDIGTGAGFPGALLAIVSPEKDFFLLDSTQKRLKVIDEFAETLGISNITTVHARAEEIARKDNFNEAFDLCVSRAVANLSTLVGWCLPFVRRGGCFISYKGENYNDELFAAKTDLAKYCGALKRIVEVNEMMETLGNTNNNSAISGHVLLVISKK